MLQLQLIDHFRVSRAADSIKPSEASGTGGCTILGHVRRFERIIGDENRSKVLVEVDLRMERVEYSMTLFAGSYRVETPLRAEKMDEVVLSFNSSITAVFDRFLGDLVKNAVTCI
tara:strand:- start:266 stop:610 length:345 start_codon:yes stop_codon:yes gene_type:complete